MDKKLRELIGQSDIWLFIKSSNGWIRNVEILEVDSEIVSFRYQQESAADLKVWEKTTRLENILEIDVRITAVPRTEQPLKDVKSKLTRLLEQD